MEKPDLINRETRATIYTVFSKLFHTSLQKRHLTPTFCSTLITSTTTPSKLLPYFSEFDF
jgi:hypothetical protein